MRGGSRGRCVSETSTFSTLARPGWAAFDTAILFRGVRQSTFKTVYVASMSVQRTVNLLVRVQGPETGRATLGGRLCKTDVSGDLHRLLRTVRRLIRCHLQNRFAWFYSYIGHRHLQSSNPYHTPIPAWQPSKREYL